MTRVKKITTRKLLREFKTYKNMLISEEVKILVVPVAADKFIEIKLQQDKNSADNIANRLLNSSQKFKVERNDIFEELFEG